MSQNPVAQIQTSDALLDYSLTTSPAPLQVSASSTKPSIGSLTIVISNSGDDVTLTSLEISLPVGDPSAPQGADLTEVGAGITGSISDAAWQVGYPGKTDGVFLVTPKSGKPIVIGDQGLAISLTNIQVSTQPGTASVSITENSLRLGGDALVPEPGAGAAHLVVLEVPKFPVGFAAGNFSVTSPVISNGGQAKLTWFGTQSTDTTYTILWTGAPADVSNVSSWTSPALTDVTTFILEVAANTPNGPVKLWFSSTQIVSTPSIVAQSLHVNGPTTLAGAVSTGPSNVTVSGDLNASGNVSSGGNVLSTGNATVGGVAQAKELRATHDLLSPSAKIVDLTAATLTVQQTAAFPSGSQIVGRVDARQASIAATRPGVGLSPGTYVPKTDGYIVATVGCPSNEDRTKQCLSTGTIQSNNASVSALGGNMVVAASAWGDTFGFMMGAVTLPVSKDVAAWVSAYNSPKNQVNAPVTFVFIPTGNVQVGELIERVSDDTFAREEQPQFVTVERRTDHADGDAATASASV